MISSGGKPFKLRYCKSLRQAKRIERNVHLFPRAFPHFYGREGKYLLFDWLEGEQLTKPILPEYCYQIGKLLGEAHSIEEVTTKKTVDTFFLSFLQDIHKARIFNQKTLAQLEETYQRLKGKMKMDVVLEFHDVHPANFLVYRNKIYFIDEDGFDYKVKGLGLAKPLLTKKWITTTEQKEAFWKGYNEHHSSDYFDRDYQHFLNFLALLRKLAVMIRTRRNYAQAQEELLQFLETS